jgi:hypothetical protein
MLRRISRPEGVVTKIWVKQDDEVHNLYLSSNVVTVTAEENKMWTDKERNKKFIQ